MKKRIKIIILSLTTFLTILYFSNLANAQREKIDINIGHKVGETLHCRCKGGNCIQGKWISFKPLCGRYPNGVGYCGVLSMNCQR